ncbi:MAG: EAL domain-containing protein [Azonexus sp.]|nr:EAL domain-containing protein [Azonexus sp.]
MRPIALTRYFSVFSLILVIFTGVVLGLLLRQHEITQMEGFAEDRNADLTMIFSKLLVSDIAALTGGHPDVDTSALNQKVVALMRGSAVVKLKLYDLKGITVFSTEVAQIGQDKSDNPGFVAARNGRVSSELTHRAQFSASEGEISDVDLLSSYVPVLENGRVTAVFELYQDVTSLVRSIDRSLWQIWLIMAAVLGGLYLLLLLIVRKAQLVLSEQQAILESSNSELDQRVATRTRELQRGEVRLRAIMDSARDAIVTVNRAGQVIGWNPAAERMFGYSPGEIMGQSVALIVPERYRQGALTSLIVMMAGGMGKDGGAVKELLGLRKDGSEFSFERSVALWETSEGQFFTAIVRDVTERRTQEAQIRQLLKEQELIFENAHVGILLLQNRKILKGNRHIARMFGFSSSSDYEGQTTELFYSSHEQYLEVGRMGYAQLKEKGYADFEVEMCRQDGRHIWVIQSGRPLIPEDVLAGPSIWVYTDISERKQAESELSIAAAAFESQEGMVVTDVAGVILRVNKAFIETTGYSAEEAIGKTPRILRSDRHDAAFFEAMWASINRFGFWQGEVWDKRKDGQVYPTWLAISAVTGKDGQVTHYVGTHTDITDRKKDEAKINQLAFFDQLTGLPNRTLLLDRLRQAMLASERSKVYGAVLFLDLDHFKALNDTLGHDQGDMLLKLVAEILSANLRQGDTVARLGGDEFVIVLASLKESQLEAATDVEVICRKLVAALKQDYLLTEAQFHASASIGATLFLGQESTLDDLLKQADLAMYKSKEAGRNTYTFFDQAMAVSVMERARIEADLRRGLLENQFLLHYQPQVEGDSERVVGAEVLLRWNHPSRGMVPPGDFIPVAEETGLILPLGHWVLETACRQLAIWDGQAWMSELTIAVNVSAHQFRQVDFVASVLKVLETTGANPHRLKLELTESLFVDNVEDIIAKMMALKARGVGFSLDDFGTGYSSLAYLSRLPLDQLKIDRSFVIDIETSENNVAICAATISLAHSLNLKVVAEGVEHEVQRYFLTSAHQCDLLQGYLISRPLPLADFEAFVRNA